MKTSKTRGYRAEREAFWAVFENNREVCDPCIALENMRGTKAGNKTATYWRNARLELERMVKNGK